MGKKPRNGTGTLPPEDEALWRAFTADIDPIRRCSTPDPSLKPAPALRKSSTAPVMPAPVFSLPKGRDIDGSTEKRLRSGKMTLDATLDLHGMTQEIAHERLRQFILSAHRQRLRCLLIITGKGSGETGGEGRGILRKRVRDWIEAEPLRSVILKIVPAARHHGGTGAFYFYLRRVRDN